MTTTTKKIVLNKMLKSQKPDKLTLRSYQVGFGDCFMLTFHYEKDHRHVLIDFGSTGRPKEAPDDLMMRVAKQIEKDCGEKLDIIVATHRHKDHIGGFETGEKKEKSGDIIRSCRPEMVIMPWTEDPKAKVDATHASVTQKQLRAFTQTLDHMHSVAASVVRDQKRLHRDLDQTVSKQLAFLGEENLKNSSAVKNLLTMGAQSPKFVRYEDSPLDLEGLLPGVTVRVLGPPDLEQSKEIKSMRSKDATQFWMLQKEIARGMDQQPETPCNIFRPGFGNSVSRSQHLFPPHTRWFIRRMNAFRGNQLLSLVRILDGVLNNTSIILLFEVGGRKLLFPGDAQIENWNYALSRPGIEKLLEDVDVYKVGHHGSRNANPISIWKGFKKKRNGNNSGDESNAGDDVLRTFMSTMAGKHGGHNPKDRTEVPRESLVEALQKESVHFSTEMLKGGELRQEFDIPLKH